MGDPTRTIEALQQFTDHPPEIMSVLIHCGHLASYQLDNEGITTRMYAGVLALADGAEYGEKGLAVDDITKKRVTFSGRCTPDQASACAVRGGFAPTTPEMIAAQDRNFAAQEHN